LKSLLRQGWETSTAALTRQRVNPLICQSPQPQKTLQIPENKRKIPAPNLPINYSRRRTIENIEPDPAEVRPHQITARRK
jgi:hypothetical protein